MQALEASPSVVDSLLIELTQETLAQHYSTTDKPIIDLMLLSVPFSGALYGALRSAQAAKKIHARLVVVLGGGYVNTELRQLREPRLFDNVDFVCVDAGERPLLQLIAYLRGQIDASELRRTYLCKEGQVHYVVGSMFDVPFSDWGSPNWDGLHKEDYLSLLDMLNPMHRLWSDGRWNKLTVAHGCYWKKCSFVMSVWIT